MNRFEFARAASVAEASNLVAEKPGSVLKAGGVDLLDHLKERLIEPPRLVDLKSIPGLDGIHAEPDGSVRIGPLVTMARIAAHPGIRSAHPALAQACGEAASPQIRNVATIGGNLLQRPRCWYYRLASYRCLTNAAMAIMAVGASLVFQGGRGTRTVPTDRFFAIPGNDPQRENAKASDEILTAIHVPAALEVRSVYASIKEKAAFDWALVSTAVAVRVDEGFVRLARIVLGAVAPVPVRSTAAEQAIIGRRLDDATAETAADAAAAGARPLSGNGYKVALLKTLVRRALKSLA
jgi:xanthine dehydrogenase YagS FAD-binding subunit